MCVKRNWPGAHSVAALRKDQLDRGKAGLVVTRTTNKAPTLLVKANENGLYKCQSLGSTPLPI